MAPKPAAAQAQPESLPADGGLRDLLQAYAALRASWPDAWPGLPRVLNGALAWLGDGPAQAADVRAGRLLKMLASAAEIVEGQGAQLAAKGAEPAYHNRLHVADTVVSMAGLLKARRRWARTSGQGLTHPELLCLLAMVIHDFHHDGRINEAPGELERRALQRFLPYARAIGLPLDDWTALTRLVLNTDPSTVGQLHEEFRSTRPEARAPLELREMAVLVTEADVLASGLPSTGQTLGESLMREWSGRYPDRAARLTTAEGRLGFLAFGARFSSPAALSLGLPEVVNAQVAELSKRLQQRAKA